MHLQRKKALLIAMFTALGMSGCGGGGSSSSPTTYSVSGTAVDGLLSGVTVCIDENSNMACDTGEPSAITDTSGAYQFTGLSSSPYGKTLLLKAGSSISGNDTGKTLILSRLINSTATDISGLVISPFTTLIYSGFITEDELKTQLGLDAATDLKEIYALDNPTDPTFLFAQQIAQQIADQLQNHLSPTTSAEDILSGNNGVIAQMANAIKNASAPIHIETGLPTLFAGITPQLNIDYVANARLEISLVGSDGSPVQNAAITVNASLPGGDSSPIEGTTPVYVETDDHGQALIELPNYEGTTSIDLIASIQKDGFVNQEKLIRGIANGDAVSAAITLLPEAVQTFAVGAGQVDLGSAQAASIRTGAPALTFALVKTTQGLQVLGGEAAAQAMADEDTDVQVGVQIPVNRIGDDVSAITAGIRGFDPSDPADSQSFPGGFNGIGDPEGLTDGVDSELTWGTPAAGEPQSYQLVSTSFAQIRLTDQNGQDVNLETA
ncbi:hypothetical protein, partial [Thiomicrorhabdus sp.]|uniref:hypothetical protein n=1 Tax=Thiomicrorhabdus sp. TaxID=2039724 RepID=UPI0029C744EE